jgi:hypothetical protein
MTGGKRGEAYFYRCRKKHLQGISRSAADASKDYSHDGKRHPVIQGALVDAAIEEILFAAVAATDGPTEAVDIAADRDRIAASLRDINERQADLNHMLYDRRIERGQFDTWSSALDEERKALDQELRSFDDIEAVSLPEGTTLRELWPEMSLDRRRQWIELVFEKVVVLPMETRGSFALSQRLELEFRNGYEPPADELRAVLDQVEGQGRRRIAHNRLDAEIEETIFNSWSDGMTTMQIGAQLRDDGVPAQRGGKWGPGQIAAVLRRLCKERGIDYQPNSVDDLAKTPLEVRELMFDLYRQYLSFADVGRELQRLGVRRWNGEEFGADHVSHVLRAWVRRTGVELPEPVRTGHRGGSKPYLAESLRKRIWRMHRQQGKSAKQIAAWLERNGIKTAHGADSWCMSTIYGIVSSVDRAMLSAAATDA